MELIITFWGKGVLFCCRLPKHLIFPIIPFVLKPAVNNKSILKLRYKFLSKFWNISVYWDMFRHDFKINLIRKVKLCYLCTLFYWLSQNLFIILFNLRFRNYIYKWTWNLLLIHQLMEFFLFIKNFNLYVYYCILKVISVVPLNIRLQWI